MAEKPTKKHMKKPLVFMPGLFNHTLHLLLQAHEYFQAYGPSDQLGTTQWQKSLYACEMSRITMRLSCVMAWLMVRKAVCAGKIPEEDVKAFYKLDSRDICLHQNDNAHELLPNFVNYLLDESHQLYERVCRLDDDLQTNRLNDNKPG